MIFRTSRPKRPQPTRNNRKISIIRKLHCQIRYSRYIHHGFQTQITSIRKKHLYDNVYAIGVPGSISTNLGGGEFWPGYPFDPKFGNKEFLEFNEKVPIAYEEFLKTKVVKCPQFALAQYNLITSEIKPGEKYIIVTHQGPFYSQTSSDAYDDKFFSSGSPGVQAAIEEFAEQIIIVVHGHTHAAKKQLFEISGVPVCNPGCAFNGLWGIYQIEGDFLRSVEMKQVEE